MVLEEKGLKYAVIEEDLGNPSSELLKIHPSGKVPVLIHEGQVIPESAVITEYLEELYPIPALMPETAGGRAQVRLWTSWCGESLKPDLDLFKYGWENLTPELREELLSRLRSCLTQLESQLVGRPYLLGDKLTLADIHLFPFYRQLTRTKWEELSGAPFAAMSTAWLARITSRPSFLRAMAR